MTKWEYAVLDATVDGIKGAYSHKPGIGLGAGSVESALRMLGNDGWEMVGVTSVVLGIGRLEMRYVFKRPLVTTADLPRLGGMADPVRIPVSG